MQLEIKRFTFGPVATIGKLYVDGSYFCYTLEDVVRAPDAPKVYGQTAIPNGPYHVVTTFSNRFQRELPLLLNVKNFEGVRIHPGNSSKDTDGCILLGKTIVGPDFIGESRVAFDAFFAKLKAAGGKAELTITNLR